MRILFVSPRQCWPPVSGAKLREYYFLRALARHAAVTYVFFSQPEGPPPGAADLAFCESVAPVPAPKLYTAGKIVRGLLGRWPLPAVNYASREMQAALARILASAKFDLVHVDYVNMAPYEGILRRGAAPLVYNWHNIESELMRRYSQNTESAPRKIYAAWTARRLAALEKRLLRNAFGHIVCSERERVQLQRLAPQARIEVIENGVDVARFRNDGDRVTRRTRIVFVGSMSYHANIEAAVDFTRSTWPAISERFPGWRLTLVGSKPAPAVLALRNVRNVEVTGTVEDVRPYYREALAAVAPLRTGGGTRLKILEAMAAGVPVVSTKLGAEGLSVNPGQDLIIAERSEEWLAALSSLAGDAQLWERYAAAGEDLVRQHYDWEMLGQRLFDTYARWLAAAR